jgi:hypothetical protein
MLVDARTCNEKAHDKLHAVIVGFYPQLEGGFYKEEGVVLWAN